MAKKKTAITGGLLMNISSWAAFVGLFCVGLGWLLGLISLTASVASALSTIGLFVILVSVVISGWVYLNKTNLPGPDIVWLIFFIIFAVLAFVGVITIG